ncbi:unnamed protein product [Cyprideis torosa]|uniref:3-oxo-5-alpha-steroid 4-dehydrogenase C-terminal domain-containing protein n=1 Tax=Cyprideis torosa TaxID=163714 RepID=A0A7R8WHV8_9CRUS|nr:unnamed protein product [Cyprideis torosa]CAG0897981.1 unnamed protein product [Cyprideis torosa]
MFYLNVDIHPASFALAILVLLISLKYYKYPSSYGRYRSSSSFSISSKIAWFLINFPAFLLFVLKYDYIVDSLQYSEQRNVAYWLLILYFSQVFYRALIYPRMLSNSASGFSVVEILVGMVFQMAAAFLIYYYVVEYMREPADFAEFAINPARVAGVFLFTVGFVFNVRADLYLSRLKGGIQEYGIPRGGLFERVSAGNYFAEILFTTPKVNRQEREGWKEMRDR